MIAVNDSIPQVASVVHDGVQFEVCQRAQSHGYLQRLGVVRAIDLRNGEELWSRAAYPARVVQAKKTDGGDRAVEVAIVSLRLDDGKLVVENAEGGVYDMDLDGRTSRRRAQMPDEPMAYERLRA